MDPLIDVALDLCANLAAEDRYRRLAAAVRKVVPCDSLALLRLQDGVLLPVVIDGLVPETLSRRFIPAEHPRLARILEGSVPVRFSNSSLPDPFDGLLVAGAEALSRVHACIGCPLMVEGTAVGVLAVDALDAQAFDDLSDDVIARMAALAAAAMRTAGLIERLEQLLAHKDLVARQLQLDARARSGGEILGTSAAARKLRDEVSLLASSDLTSLITGETGVGKEVVARAIHAQSGRAEKPLIYVNCAALPESIAESELFGHIRGAFTGAIDKRAGKFEAADGGTLLLDELCELPLSIQPKLLRVLQTGEIQRVGSDRALHVDVRVLAATNRDLLEEVRTGRFRADLYHRLSVYPLHVPPLRERREDVPILAGHFLELARARLGLGQVRLTQDARRRLTHYDWPGNVRELEHLMLRASLRAAEGRRLQEVVVQAEHLGLDPAPADRLSEPAGAPGRTQPKPLAMTGTLAEAVEDFRRQMIQDAVAQAGGNWAEAARRLGLDRGNLHRLAQRLGLTTGK
jgi:anaerobic nitric oxide reductase transcription regulator